MRLIKKSFLSIILCVVAITAASSQNYRALDDEPLRDMGITSSFALTGDYYVMNNINRRAFAGIAIGSFNNSATTEMGDEVGGSGFGIVPRIGYELGYFLRLTAEYNHTFEDDFPNYFAIGAALNIGGRRK